MHKRPSVSLWLDNRYSKKDNTYPVKIRITYKGVRSYYPTNLNLTVQEFDKAISAKPGSKLKEAHIRLMTFEAQANKIIDVILYQKNEEFSITRFENLLGLKTNLTPDVYAFFDSKITELEGTGQTSTAAGYQAAKNSFKKYFRTLEFYQVDKNFLTSHEGSLLADGKSYSTIGIYMRYLRTLFNLAIDQELITRAQYPFGRNKYLIPQPANNKRALEEDSLTRLYQFNDFNSKREEYAKDMWTLSLLCQGMNLKDIASLKFRNISDNKIVFIREKTKRKNSIPQLPITVYLQPTAITIINKWKNEIQHADEFVFPIFDSLKTDKQNIKRLQQHNKIINKYIRRLASRVGISQDVTFYSARHSFATSLKRQGRSLEEIQEFLGHTDRKTTEKYLASFGDEHKRKIIQSFTDLLSKDKDLECE